MGSAGAALTLLQQTLTTLGYGATVDGRFGPNTERAVRAFQAQAGIAPDGIAGAQTKAAIATALSGGPRPALAPAPTPTPTPSNQLGGAIAQTAEQEYRRWHTARGDLHETDVAATPILQQYYREGVGADIAAPDLQSVAWQASHPWSAVFVSWVMRTAGAGTAFRYSRGHYVYVAAAKQNRLQANAANPFWAYRSTEVAPQVGDLICASRENSGTTYDNVDDGQARATHCDIVTEVRPGSLRVVGGNVHQNVDAKTIRTLSDGRLALDGTQSRFFAVVRCRGNVNAPMPPSAPAAPAPAPNPAPVPTPTPPGVKLSPKAFVAAYGPHARASAAATGVPALVTLGQAALESGWGEKAPRFNFFGIKAKATDPEPTRQLVRTKEVLARPDARGFPQVFSVTPRADGLYDYDVLDWFRTYPDASVAFRAHGEFLVRNKRYRKAFETSDDYSFASEVARAHYGTGPSYETVLHGVMRLLEKSGFR
jgi:peptidoglycan hydrolase-like protein with peptidoglycan-binding domain